MSCISELLIVCVCGVKGGSMHARFASKRRKTLGEMQKVEEKIPKISHVMILFIAL